MAPESQNIIETVKRTVNGKVKSIQTAMTLEDFRTNGAPAAEPSQGGNTGGDKAVFKELHPKCVEQQ